MAVCKHATRTTVTTTSMPKGSQVCAACVAMGSSWVHLRKCTQCGNIACCDSSPNQHSRKHFEATKHPIVRTIQPEDKPAWAACFEDGTMMDLSEIQHFSRHRSPKTATHRNPEDQQHAA